MVKKSLKDKKKKKKKPSLKEIVNNMLLISVIYKAIHIDKRSTNFTVIGFKNITQLLFFELYINAQHLEFIT